MGQAKRRGTFNERKVQAERKRFAEIEAMKQRQKERDDEEDRKEAARRNALTPEERAKEDQERSSMRPMRGRNSMTYLVAMMAGMSMHR